MFPSVQNYSPTIRTRLFDLANLKSWTTYQVNEMESFAIPQETWRLSKRKLRRHNQKMSPLCERVTKFQKRFDENDKNHWIQKYKRWANYRFLNAMRHNDVNNMILPPPAPLHSPYYMRHFQISSKTDSFLKNVSNVLDSKKGWLPL